MTVFTAAQAIAIVGTIGFPSKMPGTSYGIPAARCPVGSLMAKLKGTVCSNCYALKGRYVFPSVQMAQETRFASLTDPQWVAAMAAILRRYHGLDGGKVHRKIKAGGACWHRWHDSGDLQGLWHLRMIVAVCLLTPEIRHWLPTREAKTVAAYLAEFGDFPANLCVRVSATKIDGMPSGSFAQTSTVHAKTSPIGFACVAPQQQGQCGDCRKCWDRDNANTGYHEH